MRSAWLVTLLLIVSLYVPAARAEVYSYTDKEGNLHFVDSPSKIPSEYRKKTRTIELPTRPPPPVPVEPGPVEAVPEERPADESLPAEEEAPPPERDLNGHDEKWWRWRKNKLETKKRTLEAELAKLEDAGAIDVQGFYTRQALFEREQRKEKLKKEIVAIDRQIASLREEARQAGAPPGWLR